MDGKIFGKRIKNLRNKRNLSLEEFVNDFNKKNSNNPNLTLKKSTVGMWESVGTVPKQELLIALSHYFEVSIDYLLGNEDMQGIKPENKKLESLQRNLGKLDEKELDKAEKILAATFDDIFEDDEEEDDN